MNINTCSWYAEAQKICRNGGTTLEKEIDDYSSSGYVIVRREFLLIGERIGDGWYVRLACGHHAIHAIFDSMPYFLPWVAWQRPGRGRNEARWYRTEQLARILKHDLNQR